MESDYLAKVPTFHHKVGRGAQIAIRLLDPLSYSLRSATSGGFIQNPSIFVGRVGDAAK
jgi:hypothetical protein